MRRQGAKTHKDQSTLPDDIENIIAEHGNYSVFPLKTEKKNRRKLLFAMCLKFLIYFQQTEQDRIDQEKLRPPDISRFK